MGVTSVRTVDAFPSPAADLAVAGAAALPGRSSAGRAAIFMEPASVLAAATAGLEEEELFMAVRASATSRPSATPASVAAIFVKRRRLSRVRSATPAWVVLWESQ